MGTKKSIKDLNAVVKLANELGYDAMNLTISKAIELKCAVDLRMSELFEEFKTKR
jgi:hypothetical protein